MANKKADLAKAKAKKQKIIAAVGGVLLVGLLAFQVPRVMKQMNKKPPQPVAVSTTTATPATGTPTLAAPTLSGGQQPTAAPTSGSASGGDSFTSGDSPPPAQDGQLASFSRFASKDPFAQQLNDDSSAGSSGGTPSGSSAGLEPVPSSSPSASPSSGSSGGSEPVPGSAVISVNGTLMSVTAGTDFPQSGSDPSSQPFFRLVSLTAHTAKISIVGGSYTSGAATVTLHENKPVTLMNTADGTRYKLILKPQGTPVPAAPVASAQTPTTSATPSTPSP